MVHDAREEEGAGGRPIKRWEHQLQETCVDVGTDYQVQPLMVLPVMSFRTE
jgi:hypothetical protein